MDDSEQITNSIQPKINKVIDTNAVKECEVRVQDFKVPILKVQTANRITKRRHSVRLLEKGIPCMKDDSIKVPKKKSKKIYLNDIKESAMILKENEKANTVNNRHIISNQYPELSDNDIVELMSQLTNFIESGVFDDSNMDWNSMSENDLNIFSPQNSALTQIPESVQNLPEKESDAEMLVATSTPPSNTAPELVLNNSMSEFVGEMPDLPELVQSEYKEGFVADNLEAIDMSVDKMDSLKPNLISKDQDTDLYPTTCCKCHKDEAGTSANTNNNQNKENTSTFQHTSINGSKNLQASNEKDVSDRQSKITKRRPTLAIVKPRQNYDLNGCSTNRKTFSFKIPKLKKPNTEKEDTSHTDILASKSVKTVSTQTRAPSRGLLGTESNFDGMIKKVVKVLYKPCVKFLKNEDCGLLCPFNHVLIPATKLEEKIKDWKNEEIHFLYLKYISRYSMCHLKYFQSLCELFAERHLPDLILATIKDCERFSLENNFLIIFLGLIRCGLNRDDSLLKMCINSSRSVASINKMLEIILSFNVINFKRTIAFLATDIETYDFDPNLGNEIIRQTCQACVLGDELLQFCYGIIRKCHYQGTLNDRYMRMLLQKI